MGDDDQREHNDSGAGVHRRVQPMSEPTAHSVLTRWWRRWSPWALRRTLRNVRNWLADERGIAASDALNTSIEVLYRYTALSLDGHPDPLAEAERYSVRGRTLHIDRTAQSQGVGP